MELVDLNAMLEVIMKKLEDLDALKEEVSQLQKNWASREAHDDHTTRPAKNQVSTMEDWKICIQAYPQQVDVNIQLPTDMQTAKMPMLKLEFPHFDGTDPIP